MQHFLSPLCFIACWPQNYAQAISVFCSLTAGMYLIFQGSCPHFNRLLTAFTFLERAYYAAPLQTTEVP